MYIPRNFEMLFIFVWSTRVFQGLLIQECGVEMKLEAEIKQHMKLEHDLEYEGLEKLVDPEYETTETEVPVEDIREKADLINFI